MGVVDGVKGFVLSTPQRAVNTFKQADLGVFKQAETWKAFGIAALMFASLFRLLLSPCSTAWMKSSPRMLILLPIPNFVFESLNRTGIESNVIQRYRLDSILTTTVVSIIILDFMAHDCSNCHARCRTTLRLNMDDWHGHGQRPLRKIPQDLSAMVRGTLNRSSTSTKLREAYHVPAYPTGLGRAPCCRANRKRFDCSTQCASFTTGGTWPDSSCHGA